MRTFYSGCLDLFKMVLVVMILLGFESLFAQEHRKAPFKPKELSITSVRDSAALIKFSSELIDGGNVVVGIRTSDDVKILSGEARSVEKNHLKNEVIGQTWEVKFARDGYYLIEIGLSYKTSEKALEAEYTPYHSFPLYVEIDKGRVVDYGYSQSTKFAKPVIEDEKEPKGSKPRATPIPFDSSKKSLGIQQAPFNISGGVTTYLITVIISGQIRFEESFSVLKGVPNSWVRLDWDYDNNTNIGYTPYYGNETQHVDYDITDNNGYYYFAFQFYGDRPANQYSPRIRVYGANANSAAFDGSLGYGASFSVYYYLDISSVIDYVYSNSAHLTVDAYQGGALRHLYRARMLSINRMNFTPHTIRYYIKTWLGNSYFCEPGYCQPDGSDMTVPRILFNRIPTSELGYHEYGHFIEWDKVGFIPSTSYSEPHWFRKQTNDVVAWREGWAEFYCAATHSYWYSVELPSLIENGRGDYEYPYPRVYQFLDFSQGTLFSDRNNIDVEGAVASFFYSLWDGVQQRAPGYSGDNDDIALSGALVLDRLIYRFNILGQLIGANQIEAYRNSVLNGTNSKYHPSVNALYNSIVLRSGSVLSATPTSLSVSGTLNSRTLTWNDNTCPNSVSYTQQTYGSYTFDLVENQETGFRIYRKATNDAWDGTLNGYSLVATAGANATSWIDNTYLTGRHSYVIVAYNGTGNSMPQAEYAVTYTPPFSVSMSGPTEVYHPEKGFPTNTSTWSAVVTGGLAPFSYTWYKTWFGSTYQVGTAQSYSESYSYDGAGGGSTQFTLRVDVRDASSPAQTTSASKTVTEYHSGGGGFEPIAAPGTELSAYFVPEEFGIAQNFPNPFNPETNIAFSLPEPSEVKIIILDVLGRVVNVLTNAKYGAGIQSIKWNSNNLNGDKVGSGIYFYRINAIGESGKQFIDTRKMLLLK